MENDVNESNKTNRFSISKTEIKKNKNTYFEDYKNIVIYGLSSEGYEIAKKILTFHRTTTIIDENSKVGIVLTRDIVKEYSKIELLMNEELLLNLQSIEKAITGAPLIFFVPRIRKINNDSKSEIVLKFKEILIHLKKNTSIFFNIPLGIKGNNEIISLIEHQTGFSIGSDIFYFYYPIHKNLANDEICIGSFQYPNIDNYLYNRIKLIFDKDNKNDIKIQTISACEVKYAIKVISYYSKLATVNETTKIDKINETKNKLELFSNIFDPIYFDQIVNGLFDLKIISSSLPTSSPLGYILNGTIKSIEGFIKSIIEEIRRLLKEKEIKASRTRVSIYWNIDKNEIRGDKIAIRELLEMKLQDYFADVEIIENDNFIPSLSTNIIIACSKYDYENIMSILTKNLHHHNSKIIIISANTVFTTMEV